MDKIKKLKKIYLVNQCITSFNDYLIGYTLIFIYNIIGFAYALSYQTFMNVSLWYVRAVISEKINKYSSIAVLKISLYAELLLTSIWIITLGLILIDLKFALLNFISSFFHIILRSSVYVKDERIAYSIFDNAIQRTDFMTRVEKSKSISMMIGALLNALLITSGETIYMDKIFIYKAIVLLHMIISCYDFYASIMEYKLAKYIVITPNDAEIRQYDGIVNFLQNLFKK